MAQETKSATDDWVDSAADSILNVIDTARTKGTDNVVRLARGIVFGLVAAVLLIAALIMSVAVLVRMLDAYLPIGDGVGDATWAAYLFLGVLLSVLGFGLWGVRKTDNMLRLQLAGVIDVVIVVVVGCYAAFG
ncbi:MAG: intracellular septation protein A [Candidatus Aldehydirespiratoraceae bacterium]|jgi:intracellular septation protein A